MNSITRIIISPLQQVRSLPTFSPFLLAAISHFIGGWTPGYASYVKICSDFVVRDPYPPSRPARNSPLAFAKKLPPEKLLGQEDLPPLPPFPPGISELRRSKDNGEGGSSLGGPSNGPGQRHSGRSLTINSEREMMDSVGSCEALYDTRCLQTSLLYTSATRDLQRSEAIEECSSTAESNLDGFVRVLSTLSYVFTSSINGSRLIAWKIFPMQQKIF